MTRRESNLKPGYTVYRLRRLFGERARTVRGWIDRGLLGKPMLHNPQVRFSRRAVVRFIQSHPEEYDLMRVERQHYMALLFGWFPSLRRRTRETA